MMMDSQDNALELGRTEQTEKVEASKPETAEESKTLEETAETVPTQEEPVDEEKAAAPAEELAEQTESQAAEEPDIPAPASNEEQAEQVDNQADEATETPTQPEEQPVPTEEEVPTPEEEVPTPKEEKPETSEEAQQPIAPKTYSTKKEILERIREIAHSDEELRREEIEYLKTTFYRMLHADRDADMKAFLDNGGTPETYRPVPDQDEEAFKAEIGVIKERRAKILKEQEAEKETNLQRKLAIIERIKTMATSPEEANKAYQEFKKLQQEWKEIQSVPASKASELWRNYQHYVEQFYDLLKLNSEAREYDFKKNLEIKIRICETAEKLAEENDIISAFHQLQKLHQEFRETGPVSKDLREQIWTRFKAASTAVNKRHQQHFDDLRAKEEDNLAKKTALCEKVEEIAASESKGSGDWERKTKEIMSIQAEWKTIGFAPKNMNVKIFERFRHACDDFFSKKAQYFRNLKEQFKENAEKKRALIERANEMKDSTEWKATSEKFVELQKEWRTIGTVPKKLGDQLWEQFIGACNHFFEARNAATSGQKGNEKANLAKKREVIAQLKQIAEGETEASQDEVQQLADQFNAIGHVPFKEKDKLRDEFNAVLDSISNNLHISVSRRRQNASRGQRQESGASAKGENERTRLMRQYESLKSEIQTYENNLGFLSSASKKGNNLIDSLNKKVEKLKGDLATVKEKIKELDESEEQEQNEI